MNTPAELTAFLLFFIGLYGLVARRSIIKTILSLWIMESAVILYFLTANHQPGAVPPIQPLPYERAANLHAAGDMGNPLLAGAVPVSDPVPQALTITTIVIGISVTAIALSMLLYLYHKIGTSNWRKARDARLEDDWR